MSSILRASPLLARRLACAPRKLPRRGLFFASPISASSSSSHRAASICSAAAASSSSSSSSSSSVATEAAVPDTRPVMPVKEKLEWVARTALCGELGEGDVGRRVRLCGWVALHRIHGGLTFLNLRDHSGIVQITTLPDKYPDAYANANKVRIEFVVAVEGVVRPRPSESLNKKMKTGSIEVTAEHIEVLNSVQQQLPFLVTTADDVKESATEEIRLRYRSLDLRRPQMHHNLILRHQVVKTIRRYLEDLHGFVEVDRDSNTI